MDPGAEINQYKIVEHIGRGGMADVWSARDQRLNRMVAIKTIAHGLSQQVDTVGLFQQEAQTIAQMEHPHILPIYDFGEYNGQLYIVMRYVAGGSLEDILRRGPMQINEAIRLGQAIAGALDYAHSNKVVHLDLKPPNVLLDSHQSPYLADFGLATVLDREGKANNPGSGTLLYMAPEQLTSEVIDHRADIYSFSIVLFHMLTGELPFEASAPLALKQLQFQEELPALDEINPALPSYLTDVLRQGTAVDPDTRPSTLMELVEEMQSVLEGSVAFALGVEGLADGDYATAEADSYGLAGADMPDNVDMAILEAVDIYSRARHAWAGGNGRFLLGVTHFMLMNGYYMDAELHGLELDEAGQQMLLRGALEYDHEVDYWWNQLDDDSCRWVCLHALRSGNPPARVRALYRLETLPDADRPQIPKLVAQALQVERNEDARIAALQVLGTRARLMKRAPEYGIKTEYQGRMLTTLTRLGIQVNPPSEWQEVVYSPEIDLLVAETALDYGMPRVAEYAARIIGRIRSTSAVRYIANQQKAGRRGGLRALALVRDEAPSLPKVVSAQGRFYAWAANTLRRMIDNPLSVIARYVAALIGGWIAMGFHVVSVFRGQAIFTQQRWANAIAIGLIFGLIVGFIVLFSGEFSSRLRKFWPWWVRGVVSLILGTLWGAFAWWAFQWFFLGLQPGNDIIFFGGFGLALGLVLTALLNLRSWIAVPLTAFFAFVPVYATFQLGWMNRPLFYRISEAPFELLPNAAIGINWRILEGWDWAALRFFESLLYYDSPRHIFDIAIPVVILVAIGAHFPAVLRDVQTLLQPVIRMLAARRAAREALAVPQPVRRPVPIADADALKTELDIDLGTAAPEKADTGLTELDAVMGAGRAEPGTELDINQGLRTPEQDKPTSPQRSESRRVTISTGIRIDDKPSQSPNITQKLDVQVEQDDDGSAEDEPNPGDDERG
jgi:hypothetical protein